MSRLRKRDTDLLFAFGSYRTRVVFINGMAPTGGGRRSAGLPSEGGHPPEGRFFESGRPALLVVDQNIFSLHSSRLVPDEAASVVSVPAGENSKSWEQAREILTRALQAGLDREGMIVGIGGGMVCDLAAFCASVYMRGCRLILVPTSLLAMVDASLGGKTAVNLEGLKNLVGTFYPAEEIRIRIDFLESLPDREFRSGLAEVIKTALLDDEELVTLLEVERERFLRRDLGLLSEAVRRCLIAKARVVEEDFHESGRRAILNLGHTFAHALEAASGLGVWTHGEAVAWGTARAARLGVLLGVTPGAHADRTLALLEAYGYRVESDAGVQPERLVAAMRADKKRRRGKLRLVLQRGIGDTVVQAVDETLILQSLKSG
jgi:3-dehydroquinate synthase